MINQSDFPDININEGDFHVHIDMSRWAKGHEEAQKWLDRQIIEDMEPFVPIRTGRLRNYLKNVNAPRYGTGSLYVYKKPLPQYPTLLYYGYNSNGKPIRYSCPTAQKMWFEATKRVHGREWSEGVRQRIGGR